jgi:hypothetical protein
MWGNAAKGPYISILHVGTFRPSFDQVEIAMCDYPAPLHRLLPIESLVEFSHRFQIDELTDHPHYRSKIKLTCAQNEQPIWIFNQWTHVLAPHSLTKAELAFDIKVKSSAHGWQVLLWLVRHLGKTRHQRCKVVVFDEPSATDAAYGQLPFPTFYFEDRSSSVALKLYMRLEKLPQERFGGIVVRLEWSLKGSAVRRHLRGKQVSDLLDADLNGFLRKNLVLETLDTVALGRLLAPRQARTDARARRVAGLFARINAYNEWNGIGDWEIAYLISRWSPAQVRGNLKALRAKAQAPKKGRPPKIPKKQSVPVTDYRINKCFNEVPIRLRLEP